MNRDRTARDASPFRSAVWKVIADLDSYRPGNIGSRVELRTSNFSLDREKFAEQVSIELKKAEQLIGFLSEAEKQLEAVASLRAKEKSPRWQANYDLIYAQVVGYQARAREYGWYLEEFAKNPKPVKNIYGAARPTRGWFVRGVPRLLKPDATQAQRDKADQLFRDAHKDRPGTPWAERAKDELSRGYGIELVEG